MIFDSDELSITEFYLNNMELALDYRIYKSYRVLEKLGKGVYGEVYKAVEKATGKQVAIKKILEAFQNLTDAKRTYRQLGYLLQLHHPSIINLHRVIVGEENKPNTSTPRNVYAIFQLMHLDLAKTIQLCRLEPLQRKYICLQITSAVQFLHNSDLIHRDIKPSNILVDQSCTAKICDFGLVRRVTDFHCQNIEQQQVFTQYVASKWYRAPQIMLNGNNMSSKSIDMWSIGCVAAQMILGTSLFTGNSMIQQLQRMFEIIGMPSQEQIESLPSEESKFLLRNFKKLKKKTFQEIFPNITVQELDFICSLLVFDPSKRLNATQALKHPYFDELSSMKPQFKGIPVKIYDFSQHKNSTSLQDYCQLIQSLSVQTQRTNKSKESKNSNDSNCKKQYLMKYEKVDFMPEKSTRSSNCGMRGNNLHTKYSSLLPNNQGSQVDGFYRVISRPESQSSLLSHKILKSNNTNPRPKSKVSQHKERSRSKQSQDREKCKKIDNSSKNSLHSYNKSSKSRKNLQLGKSSSKNKIFRPNSEIIISNANKPPLLTSTLTKIPKKKKKL